MTNTQLPAYDAAEATDAATRDAHGLALAADMLTTDHPDLGGAEAMAFPEVRTVGDGFAVWQALELQIDAAPDETVDALVDARLALECHVAAMPFGTPLDVMRALAMTMSSADDVSAASIALIARAHREAAAG